MLNEINLKNKNSHEVTRLNPCFNGICSMRIRDEKGNEEIGYVLILVLMEYAQ